MNGVDYSKQESEEVRKLKRQISDLKEENEFLKKATAYLCPLGTSSKKSGEVCLYRAAPKSVFGEQDVPVGQSQSIGVLQMAGARTQ